MNTGVLMNSENLSNLIGLIYGSVKDDKLWEFFIDSMRTMLHADSALLFTPLNTPDEGGIDIRINTDEWSLRAYREHYKDQDLWYAGSLTKNLNQSGSIVLGEELVDEREFRRSGWLNDFLRPSKQCRLLGANVENNINLGGPAFMNFYKSSESSFFTEDDRSIVRLLLPHVQRAFHMRADQARSRKRVELLEGAVRANAAPYIILNAGLHIVVSNGTADDILAEKDGLYRSIGNRLRCTRIEVDEHLSNFLLLAVSSLSSSNSNALLLQRPSGKGAILLQACVIEPEARKERYVLLTLVAMGAEQARTSALVVRQLGLTAAEARLAAVIGAGVSPADAAEELGISEGNVRTALKKVFLKLGISRQSELAVLVTRIGLGRIAS